MLPQLRFRSSIVLATAFAGACGTTSSAPSKNEFRDGSGKADNGEDVCALFGWYGDGECDTFCPMPDPDCPAPPALDPAQVQMATGATSAPDVTGNVVKVSFPRTDIPIEIDGFTMPPFMGLTSYGSFMPSMMPGMEAMVMGDVVLFEDEVDAAMTAALNNGLQVTALHNHFFYENPKIYFMHIGGMGAVDTLGGGVKAVLAAQNTVRAATPIPATSFGAPALPATSTIDATKLDPIFTVTGTAKNGMYKAVMGRKVMSPDGQLGAAMGIQTWAAFFGANDNAVVDGDFAVTQGELQAVLKSLRESGIHIVAIHSHMMGTTPALTFLHYWGRGSAEDLAMKVKTAVDLTEWDGKH